jgi:hypothetical protein
MCNYIEQSTDIVPAWLTEAPPLLLCTSCGGMGPRGCTDCEEDDSFGSPVSDASMEHASNVLSRICKKDHPTTYILQELIRDIESKHDDRGNIYPGIYPYWEYIASYNNAADYLKSLEPAV